VVANGAGGGASGARTIGAMQQAFVLSPPGVAAIPLILDSPHSGQQYPADFGSAQPLEVLREGEDAFVERLYEGAPRLGASLLAAQFPRVYIDPNRSLDDIDPAMLDAPWPGAVTPGRKTELGIGLIWRTMGQGREIYDRRLTVAEVQARIQRCYRPYHLALKRLLDDALARHGRRWHLNVHSMPDDSYAQLGLPGKTLADFVLGNLDGRTSDAATLDVLEGALRAAGYTVARNDPFKGVDLIARYGDPAARCHSVQIEIKRSLYMDVATHRPNAGFERARAALQAMLEALAGHIAGSARSA